MIDAIFADDDVTVFVMRHFITMIDAIFADDDVTLFVMRHFIIIYCLISSFMELGDVRTFS